MRRVYKFFSHGSWLIVLLAASVLHNHLPNWANIILLILLAVSIVTSVTGIVRSIKSRK